MSKTSRWFRGSVQTILAGVLLLSMTGCKQEGASPSAPSQEESSASAAPLQFPELPESRMLVTSPAEGDFVIVENGTAKACIVVPEEPGDKVWAAAVDLQTYLEKITGARLVIEKDSADLAGKTCLLVGPTKQTAALGIEQPTGYPKKERVILKRVGSSLALLGNDDMRYEGTADAVTMFLENLGCGWYGPQELWQVVPEYPTLAIGELDIEHTPQFRSRQNQVYSTNATLARRWYLGGDKTMVGHGISGLIPIKEYAATHPEWFALVDGKRDPASVEWWQYDYTNPEFAAEVAKKVLEKWDADPLLTNYSLASNDGWEEGWCECETCAAAGNPTDQMLTFANRVAEIVSKKYPDKTISVLSYHNNFFPPEKVKVHPNVEVMFCRETSMTIPLDLGVEILGKNDITHNTYTQSWRGNFQEFIQKSQLQNVSIWEWYCIATERPLWQDVPWVQGSVATRNHALWKQNGAEYVFYDQGPATWHRETDESYPLRWPLWFVAAKGMWDGSFTGEQILYDSCRKLYGAAADEMYGYYKALADSSEQCRADSTCWIPCKPGEMYTDDRVEVIDAALEAAKAKFGEVTDEQKQRIENQITLWKQAALISYYN